MPPKRIQRRQLHMPNIRPSMESLRASLSWCRHTSTRCVSVLAEEEINDVHSIETQVVEKAHNSDNSDDDEVEDKDDLTLPETEDNRSYDNILSKITKNGQKEMLEQNRMLLKLLFEQQADLKEEWTRMGFNSTTAEPQTDWRVPSISSKSLWWLTPYDFVEKPQSWISSLKHYGETFPKTRSQSSQVCSDFFRHLD